jgi:hypothetical protein
MDNNRSGDAMPINNSLHPLSIRAMKFLLGLLLLSQALELARDLPAMLEPQVYPTLQHDNQNYGLPLSAGLVAILFRLLVYAGLPVFGVLLCTGIKPRLVSLGAFLVVMAIQHDIAPFLQGGDALLRLLLFWSIFLPMWSKNPVSKTTSFLLSERLACWAFTLQICFVYWFAAALKTDPLWTRSGDALFYALNIEHFTTPLGLYLRQFHGLLQVFTFATRCFEFLGPLLLLIPFYQGCFRMLAVILFISFHLIGMHSLLRVGLFPWVCATAWVAFIPGFFWEWLGKVSPRLVPYVSTEFPKLIRKPKRAPVPPPIYYLDRAASLFVVVCFLDVMAWNVASLQREKGMTWMDRNDRFGGLMGLRQQWNMYAPRPRTIHGWLIVPTDLADGTEVDLFTAQSVSWDKPNDIGAYFGDDRWRR